MAQCILPILPAGSTLITDTLSVINESNQWTYFHGLLPVFTHEAQDVQIFQMFTAQLAATGACKLVEIHHRPTPRPTASWPNCLRNSTRCNAFIPARN